MTSNVDFESLIGWSPTFAPCSRCKVETTRSPCWGCLKREDAERAVREAEKVVGIPDGFAWARRGTPELAERVKTAAGWSVVLDAVTGFSGTTVLLIGSESRVGKTSMACAALRELPGGLFTRASGLARAGGEHPMGQGSAPLIRRAKAARVLVIDEFGGPDYPLHLEHFVLEVLWTRHEERHLTIVTTGLTEGAIESRCGQGTMGRLREKGSCLTVRFGSPQARDQDPRQGQLGQVTAPSPGAS